MEVMEMTKTQAIRYELELAVAEAIDPVEPGVPHYPTPRGEVMRRAMEITRRVLAEPGRYVLEVRYGQAQVLIPLEVGQESLARKLYALGLEARDLSGIPLLTVKEMLGEAGERLLIERTLAALKEAAPLATGARLTAPLPRGPYAGKSVQELLRDPTPELVRAFYQAVLEAPELLGEKDVVNAFVEWLLGL